jgi:hypothetical protein
MRVNQRGTVLFGCAGGLVVVAGGLAAAYYAVATRSEARAGTIKAMSAPEPTKTATGGKALTALLAKQIDIKIGLGIAHLAWSELGVEVDPDELGRAGGTCQISTTLFGASFFAGLEIPTTTNHSRPSAYTPLAFDATVVWPDTDLVLKNPYDFPVAIHYRVANGEALVEILGKPRPFDKIVFARKVLEENPYATEERLDDEMPDGQTMLDQPGFNGYKLTRFRRFYKGKQMVREQKWTVNYKPVTEYVRRGTNKDPDAKMPKEKDSHALKAPNPNEFNEEKVVLVQ